ncbi:MAG: hypothetical protein ABIJ37_03510 [Pseudomonadota bacterium]
MERRKILYLIAALIVSLTIIPSFARAGSLEEASLEGEILAKLARIEEGQKALNTRINDLDSKLSTRIDDLRDLLYVILVGMFGLVGFILWDRRTTLAPVARKTTDLEEREERLERVLKEFALKNAQMREVLQAAGML